MGNQMTKSQLLDNIRAGRARWEAVLSEVGDERMALPGVEGDWSVKDIVAHVNFWEGRLVEHLQAASRNEAPAPVPWGGDIADDTDRRNAWIYERVRDLPLNEVLAQSQQTYRQLLEAVHALSAEDLTEPGRFQWMEGGPLWEAVPGDNYEHYDDHAESIRTWLGKQ